MKILGYEFKIKKPRQRRVRNFKDSSKNEKPTVALDKEIGESGTDIVEGVLYNTDYNSNLTGSKAIETYDEMRKSDGVVKASLMACTLPIRSTRWFIKPASDDKKDQEIAEFIEHNLFNDMSITWDDFIRQSLLMLTFGFMVFEKVFKIVRYNGKDYIGIKKFSPRMPATIEKWMTADKKPGVVQWTNNGGEISIPIEKLLIFTHDKEGDNWTGISVLRSAYRAWKMKREVEKWNAIGFQRQSLGIPVIKLPPGYSTADKKKAKKIGRNVRANEEAYLVLTPEWDFEFADMKANTTKDPTESINRYNREILIGVLAQFMDLGSGPNGSRALSTDQSTTFHSNLNAVANGIKNAINTYAIKQLVDLNFDVNEYPELDFAEIGKIDYNNLSTALQRLTQVSIITPDAELEGYVRDIMKLPEKMEEEPEKKKKPEKMNEEMIFFEPWRSLTFAEKKVNFRDINKKMEIAEKALGKELKDVLLKGQKDFYRQLELLLASSGGDISKRIKRLAVKYKPEYRKAIYTALKDAYEYGKATSAMEMKKTVPNTPSQALQAISMQADAITSKMDSDIVGKAKLSIIDNMSRGRTKAQTLALTSDIVKKEVEKYWRDTSSVIVSGGINQGRRRSFEAYGSDIYALQRSEILDSKTCNYCMSIDRRVCKKTDPMTKIDSVHSHCRGIWVEIMKEEPEKPKVTGIPKSLQTKWGGAVNLVNQPKKPLIKK